VRDTLEVGILECLCEAETTGLLDDSLQRWVDSHEMKGLVVTLQPREDSVRLKTTMDMETWNQEVSEVIIGVWGTSGEEAFPQEKAGWEVLQEAT